MHFTIYSTRHIAASCSVYLSIALAVVSAGIDVFGADIPSRPNIIFILTDDQGYGDISAHGNPVLKTPNLDRIAREGVQFEDFHVSPTCSPTRSALMTGRHEFRNGVTHTIMERERLTLDATTLPQILKTAGYTTGIFGKWHLGDEAEYQPNRRGFDEVFIHGTGGIGQAFAGVSSGDVPNNSYFNPFILHNGKFEKTNGYCTDVFFAQALQWIEKVKGTQPFYCHLATNAPHAPLHVRPEDEARYQGQPEDVAKFFGMIANIDDNVGRLLDQIQAWGLEKNTLVIFMNDNGGTAGVKVFNAGMRGSKGTPWLGGTRASSFWRWPGTLQPHKVNQLTAHIDFFPTLAELAGVTLPDLVKQQVEGRSLVPLLKNSSAPWDDRKLFTHVGRWPKATPPEQFKYTNCSVRNTRWHLVSVAAVANAKGKNKAKTNNAESSAQAWQLFDLAADPGESKNVAAEHPAVVAELSAAYDQWWGSVQPQLVNENASSPPINPFKQWFLNQYGDNPPK